MLRSVLTDSVKRLACTTEKVLVTGLPVPRKYSTLTEQSLTGSEFDIVINSVKPAPTFPSAKYQVLLPRPDPGGGVGVGVIVVVGEGVGDFVAVGEGLGVFVLVGDAVVVPVGVALRVTAELAWSPSPRKVTIARIMAIR